MIVDIFIGVATSSIVGAGGGIWAMLRGQAKIRKRREEREAQEDEYRKRHELLQDEALKQLLKDSFHRLAIPAIELGECDPDTMSLIRDAYAAYHRLGGNSTGTAIWDQVRALPLTASRHFFVGNSLKEEE